MPPIATHSPLVVNELGGDEVTVVRRTTAGNELTLMKEVARIPADARSLRIWIERARVALEVESPATPA